MRRLSDAEPVASRLLSSGVSIKAVADWLGYASPTVTLAPYAHLMPVDDDRARRVLDEAFKSAGELLGTGTDGGMVPSLVSGGDR